MDSLSSSGPVSLPVDPKKIQEMNAEINRLMKQYPERYLAVSTPEERELQVFLINNRDKFSIDEGGKIIIDEANIPPKLLEAAKNMDLITVTNHKAPETSSEKPFGMK